MTSTIYVVTSGSYSDYHIEQVFLNKEKAEEYIEKFNKATVYDEARLEEYETFDENKAEAVDYIWIRATKILGDDDIKYVEIDYDVDFVQDGVFNKNTYFDVTDKRMYPSGVSRSEISIRRKLDKTVSKDVIELKYKKVLQDMFFMIESNFDELSVASMSSDVYKDTVKAMNDKS